MGPGLGMGHMDGMVFAVFVGTRGGLFGFGLGLRGWYGVRRLCGRPDGGRGEKEKVCEGVGL